VVPFLVLIRIHLLLRAGVARLRDQRGQTSAEYALVLLGAASVALLIALWAKDTDKIGKLLDAIFESITKLVK
jgi:Flp pilus assembly pilin Flp